MAKSPYLLITIRLISGISTEKLGKVTVFSGISTEKLGKIATKYLLQNSCSTYVEVTFASTAQ